MPQLTIDGRSVEVGPGKTVLDAARALGLDIPTLCYVERCGPMTACLVCVVKVTANGRSRIVPSCGMRAEDGMVVESETDEVRALRRSALELLLSDHVGDCLSPCHRICPLSLNIPRMLREIQAQRLGDAVVTVRQALALPGVLGRLCHAPCENGCRRAGCGGSAAIRELERHVADHDLAASPRYLPPRKPATGKRVAIVGAGPAGLAAAYHLLRQGHGCALFDRHPEGGGSLRRQVDEANLPRAVLDAELRWLAQLGARFVPKTELGVDVTLATLVQDFDAVLLTTGEFNAAEAARLGVPTAASGAKVDPATGRTPVPGVFAAGSVVKPVKQLVRAMSEGQAVAESMHRHLTGHPPRVPPKLFSSVMGRLEEGEVDLFLKLANPYARLAPAAGAILGFTRDEAVHEAGRCLHCDCRAAGSCGLQHYAQLYGASPNRFARQRRRFEQHLHSARVLFEPGKCILCGICIHIAREAAEPLGLTFVGRGFNVQVAAPLHHPFAEGLQKVAAECVEHCPTGAITFREPEGAIPAAVGSEPRSVQSNTEK
jgi:ferredoxin